MNLWVARSREALDQFRLLRLPVAYVPYTVDTKIFRPLAASAAEAAELRKEFDLPEDGYLIANFHRDTEGGDLASPKTQKAPELFLAILRKLREAGKKFTVLLAGPRRHWLRGPPRGRGHPVSLRRENRRGRRLRCEHSRPSHAGEALRRVGSLRDSLALGGRPAIRDGSRRLRCKVLSTPVGLALDILNPRCLFRTAADAAEMIAKDMQSRSLDRFTGEHFEKATLNHSSTVLPDFYRAIYGKIPVKSQRGGIGAAIRQFRHTFSRRFRPAAPAKSVCLAHTPGSDPILDEILANVEEGLRAEGVEVSAAPSEITLIGTPEKTATGFRRIQFVSPQTDRRTIRSDAIVVAPSVQDVVNLRRSGVANACVAIPFIFSRDQGGEPLVIDAADIRASISVWRALAAGGRSSTHTTPRTTNRSSIPGFRTTTPEPREGRRKHPAAFRGFSRGDRRSPLERLRARPVEASMMWRLREAAFLLRGLPARVCARRRRAGIAKAGGAAPVIGFGGVLDGGGLVHGGAVKLLHLRKAFAHSEPNSIFSTS